MTDAVGSGPSAQNALYWHRREQELTRIANALYRAVDECKGYQETLTALGETEKIGSEPWEAAMRGAKQSLRTARVLRSRFRKQIYAMKDTLRIRTYLAADAPPDLAEKLDKGIEYLDFLEACGF